MLQAQLPCSFPWMLELKSQPSPWLPEPFLTRSSIFPRELCLPTMSPGLSLAFGQDRLVSPKGSRGWGGVRVLLSWGFWHRGELTLWQQEFAHLDVFPPSISSKFCIDTSHSFCRFLYPIWPGFVPPQPEVEKSSSAHHEAPWCCQCSTGKRSRGPGQHFHGCVPMFFSTMEAQRGSLVSQGC